MFKVKVEELIFVKVTTFVAVLIALISNSSLFVDVNPIATLNKTLSPTKILEDEDKVISTVPPAETEVLGDNPVKTLLIVVFSVLFLITAADVDVLIKSPVIKLSNPSFT